MEKKQPSWTKIYLGVTLITFLAVIVIGLYYFTKDTMQSPTKSFMDFKLKRESETYKNIGFNLVGPSQAPEPLRALAKLGFHIMVETHTYAPEYVGDRLNCTNCHFAGGDTSGGPQGGISLVGASTQYPRYDGQLKRVLSFPERINNCFKRSMNGKPLPLDSDIMLALVTYLQWISKDLPVYGTVPWLGLEPLKTAHVGNPENGMRVYEKYCALCHRDEGQGGNNIPPLWGEGSFNDAAGFNKLPELATFIYWNMPYENMTPVLSEDEAIDVAAYMLSKPRAKANY